MGNIKRLATKLALGWNNIHPVIRWIIIAAWLSAFVIGILGTLGIINVTSLFGPFKW